MTSRWTRGRVAMTTMALLVACGCTRSAPSTAPASDASSPDPLDVALAQAKKDHARYLAVAGNLAKWKKALDETWPKRFAAEKVATRLPTGFDEAKLENDLGKELDGYGLGLDEFHDKVEKLTIPKGRTIPDTLAPGEPFSWLADEVRRVVSVGIVVTPADKPKLKKWVDAQFPTGRLFRVDQVKLPSKKALIDLTTWYFVPMVKVPVRHLDPIDANKVLTDAGVDLVENGGSKKALEVRRLYKEVNDALPKVNEAWAVKAKLRLFEARYTFFKHAVAESKSKKFRQVLK